MVGPSRAECSERLGVRTDCARAAMLIRSPRNKKRRWNGSPLDDEASFYNESSGRTDKSGKMGRGNEAKAVRSPPTWDSLFDKGDAAAATCGNKPPRHRAHLVVGIDSSE